LTEGSISATTGKKQSLPHRKRRDEAVKNGGIKGGYKQGEAKGKITKCKKKKEKGDK